MKPTTDHTEARRFERNAARGVRDMGMAWLLRKLVVPIALVLLLVVAVTYQANGLIAALPAAIVMVFYVVWVSDIYRRNFLHGAPFRRTRPTDRLDK